MRIVILIPTYNERENIRTLLPRVVAAVPQARVIVIDDNSPDNTAAEVLTLANQHPQIALLKRPGKNGLGQAYMDAFRRVLSDETVDVVCTMDADLSHAPESLPGMLTMLEKGDMVIGSRYTPGGSIEGWELWRKFLSGFGNRYCRLVTRLPIKDCTSGFGCISAAYLRKIDWSDFDTSGYAFLMYLKFKLWRSGARLLEFPIHFQNRLTGESKISLKIVEEGLFLPWRLIQKRSGVPPTCPACKKENTTYWFTKNKCALYRCQDCRLIFVDPLPDQFTKIYSEDYFRGATEGHGYVHYDQEKDADKKTFNRYLDIIESFGATKGALLDVGAATGAFVAAAKNRGYAAEGLEISDYAAKTGRDKGLNVMTGTFDTVQLQPNKYSVITLWDVFEHVPDGDKTLESVSAALSTNGIAAFNTPNALSIWARITGRYWPLLVPPEHIRLYNPKNFAALLENHGFEVLTTTTIGKRFTLAYIFQIAANTWHSQILKKVAHFFDRPLFNSIAIPLNLHDNMFVVAKKKS